MKIGVPSRMGLTALWNLFAAPTSLNRYGVDLTLEEEGTYTFTDWSGSAISCNTNGYWRSLTPGEWSDIFNRMCYSTTISNLMSTHNLLGPSDFGNRKPYIYEGYLYMNEEMITMANNAYFVVPIIPDGYIPEIAPHGTITDEDWAELAEKGVALLPIGVGKIDYSHGGFIDSEDYDAQTSEEYGEDVYTYLQEYRTAGFCIFDIYRYDFIPAMDFTTSDSYKTGNRVCLPLRLAHVE